MTRLAAVKRGLLVGLIVGVVISSFRFTINNLLAIWKQLYHFAGSSVLGFALVILLFIILTLIIGRFIKHNSHIMGSGIPEVELQLIDKLKLNPISILVSKFIAGALSISTGGFLGREGPSVQLGAAVGQIYAEKFRLTNNDWRLLVATGAASGLSAAFGAPLAGTMFVLEEISHSFSSLLWIEALSGSLVADIVSDHFFGLKPVLYIHYENSFPLKYYWLLLILGLILGILGFFYQEVTLNVHFLYKFFKRIPRENQIIVMLVTILPIGIFYPQLLGGGENLIKILPTAKISLAVGITFFLIRFIFSAISFGSGAPGGIFMPILTLGALIGLIVGKLMIIVNLMPVLYLPNLIIFSLAGYFACISKAPFTAIILIAEMVGSLSHLLPLTFVSLVAYLLIDILGGAPIYESLSKRIALKHELSYKNSKLVDFEFSVSSLGELSNKEIREITWPHNVILIKVLRDDAELLGKGDLILQPKDRLILLAHVEDIAKIKHELSVLN
ncbi:ClC family H(+)/Cl(-) exchange transporter [Liquorilactobacillus capillatus]|uniref:Chloride channel protein EriC n=1 Tax=Liquorilactobacillus capillatus DSM 19910 TaxID=1423731 RepID=A0A0R1M5X4_9LACO|nr:ClC family H(+)/Cl(-) exchange transporter [Liquorilactobacillus capillatus]KRL00932.1 chloride channel protein EriC [Liquorilactobacillus capillatus DSM 19910]